MPFATLGRLVMPVIALVGAVTPAASRAPDRSDSKRPAPRRAVVYRPHTAAVAAVAAPATLMVPVVGVLPAALRDGFTQPRSGHVHHAIDIMAARGTPVVSATDGKLLKLHRSRAGGLMVYAADAADRHILMYAHLDRYAPGLAPGATLRRGQLLGYVGTTGNAPANAPHLHFAVARGRPSQRWWKGDAVNPYPLLAKGVAIAAVPALAVARTVAAKAEPATAKPAKVKATKSKAVKVAKNTKATKVKAKATKSRTPKARSSSQKTAAARTAVKPATARSAVKRSALTRSAVKHATVKRSVVERSVVKRSTVKRPAAKRATAKRTTRRARS